MTSKLRAQGRPAGKTGEELISVAREVFLEYGYERASMDEIAKRASISKASLYREHPAKTALYAAVVRHWSTAGRNAMRPALERLRMNPEIRAGLIELAETMQRGILSPPVLAMRRLVTAEAPAHPEVAAAYLQESWNTNIGDLATTLQLIATEGRLSLDDAVAAANQFTWLVIGAPLNASMLNGQSTDRDAAPAVDLFLAGYAPERSELAALRSKTAQARPGNEQAG